MPRPVSLILLVASLTLVGIAHLAALAPAGAPAWAPWALLTGSVAALLAVALLGAASGKGGVPRRLLLPLAFVFLLLVGGVGAGLLLPDPAPGDPLPGGLPLPAALLLYGAGLLPLLVVPLAYAWAFPAAGFAEGELERVREAAHRAAGRDPERPFGALPGEAEHR